MRSSTAIHKRNYSRSCCKFRDLPMKTKSVKERTKTLHKNKNGEWQGCKHKKYNIRRYCTQVSTQHKCLPKYHWPQYIRQFWKYIYSTKLEVSKAFASVAELRTLAYSANALLWSWYVHVISAVGMITNGHERITLKSQKPTWINKRVSHFTYVWSFRLWASVLLLTDDYFAHKIRSEFFLHHDWAILCWTFTALGVNSIPLYAIISFSQLY